jgi:prepilin-type N-terminal cleavage/methylation domain-containing protein
MNRKGFTLIELIMVIVILGILAAIAIPRYVDLTTKAKQAAMDGTLGAIRSAVAMDYAERITNSLSGYAPTLYGTMFAEGVIPNNPMSTSNVNAVVTSGKTGTGGWAYYPSTGTVESNN